MNGYLNPCVGMAACEQLKPETPADAGFYRAAALLEELEQRIAALRNRVEPVLSPEVPETGKAQNSVMPAPIPRSTVTHRFEATADRIGALLNQVNGIINRVEV